MNKLSIKRQNIKLLIVVVIFTSTILFTYAKTDSTNFNYFSNIYCKVINIFKTNQNNCENTNINTNTGTDTNKIKKETILNTSNSNILLKNEKQTSNSNLNSNVKNTENKKSTKTTNGYTNTISNTYSQNTIYQNEIDVSVKEKLNYLEEQINQLKKSNNVLSPFVQPVQYVFTGNNTSNNTSNNVSATVDTNTINSNLNSLQTFINNLGSNIVSIINSFSESVSGNILTSNINGVIATTSIITSNNVNYADGLFTSNINGVIATTSITELVSTTTNSFSSLNNTLTSNVNGVSVNANIINSNIASSSGNVFQTIVNGISSTFTKIINSFSEVVSGNTLTTEINGQIATTSIITNNSLSSIGSQIISNINGISSSLDLTNVISSSTNNNLNSNNNTLTSIVNGKSSNVNIINSNIASTTGNYFENIINGISSGVKKFINSFSQSVSGNVLTTNINGEIATTSVVSSNTISSNNNTLTSNVNGVVSSSTIINSNSLSLSGNNLSSNINGIISSSLDLSPIISGAKSSLSASAPLSYNNSTGAFSISQANSSTNGYLSSTDWNTFNNKQANLVSGTNIKTINGSSILGSGNISTIQSWGSITGTLSNQTDLQNALNAKQNILTNPITGTGSSGQISFWNRTNTQTGSSNLFWDNTNGRLGVGTTMPTDTLDIYDSNNGGHLTFGSANSRFNISSNLGNDMFTIESDGGFYSRNSNGQDKFVIGSDGYFSNAGIIAGNQYEKLYSSLYGGFGFNGVVQDNNSNYVNPNIFSGSSNGDFYFNGIINPGSAGFFQSQTMYLGSYGDFTLTGKQNYGTGWNGNDTFNIDPHGNLYSYGVVNNGYGDPYQFSKIYSGEHGDFSISTVNDFGNGATPYDVFHIDQSGGAYFYGIVNDGSDNALQKEILQINSNGYIGINIPSYYNSGSRIPRGYLDVYDTDTARSSFLIENGGKIRLGFVPETSTDFEGISINGGGVPVVKIGSSGYSGSGTLFTVNDNLHKFIFENGNIGINTDTPTESLEVSGNIKADSFITTNGSSDQLVTGDGTLINISSLSSSGNYLPLTGGTVTGNINMSASIIPTADNTYSLGSASSTWKDVYVGPGSLYVNGQEVVHTDITNDVVVTADPNQSVRLYTQGTGDIEMNPSGSGQLLLKSNLVFSSGKKIKTTNDTPILSGEDFNPFYNGMFNLGSATATWNNVYATKFITTGGSSSQLVAGDGTLINTSTLQSALVSGTNIKTINGSSILGSGDITITTGGTPSGSTGQLQFNNAGSFGSDSNLFWDNVNKRLGVGTTTPSYKLDVKSSLTGAVVDNVGRFSSDADYVAFTVNANKSDGTGQTNILFQKKGIQTWNMGSDFAANGTKDFFVYDATNSNNPLYVANNGDIRLGSTGGTNTGGYWNTQRMTILANSGNVGIGTTTPSAKLHINSSSSTIPALYIGGTNPYLVGNRDYLTIDGTGNVGITLKTAFGAGNYVANRFLAGSTELGVFYADASTNDFVFKQSLSTGVMGFETNATRRMTILNNGNVGIGTITPQNQLHITGSSNTSYLSINSGVGIQSNSSGSGLITALALSPSDPTSGISNGANFGFNGAPNNFYGMGLGALRNSAYDMWFQTGAVNGGGYRWYIGTTERMTMDKNGNVGIGTITPQADLDITKSVNGGVLSIVKNTNSGSSALSAQQIMNDATNGDYSTLVLSSTYTTSGLNAPNRAKVRTGSGLTNGLVFTTGSASPLIFGTNDTERVRIDSVGNVGIGTTSPVSTLQVLGTATFGAYGGAIDTARDVANFYINNASNAGIVRFMNAGAGQGLQARFIAGLDGTSQTMFTDSTNWIGAVAVTGSNANANNNSMQFRLRGTADANSEAGLNASAKMTILGSGNVGIGATTPSAKLHVAGTVRFSNFGAGTLQTDASGNLTVSSDERLKDISRMFNRSITDILKINPITYHWNSVSGLDMNAEYSGFSAQNIQSAIPEAVSTSTNGFLALQDRPILAAVVNAIKDIAQIAGEFKNKLISWLGSEDNGIQKVQTGEICLKTSSGKNICINGDKLEEIISLQNNSSTNNTNTNSNSTNNNPSTPTDNSSSDATTNTTSTDNSSSTPTTVDNSTTTSQITPSQGDPSTQTTVDTSTSTTTP